MLQYYLNGYWTIKSCILCVILHGVISVCEVKVKRRSWCGINILSVQLEHKPVCFMRWPRDVWQWRLISGGLSAPVLILSPHTFPTPPHPRPGGLWLFPWYSFNLLPSDSVCTALHLCAASLTHWDNVYLFIFTGQPSPHHRQRRLTRCRPLCKYLFSLSLSAQYIYLSFTLPLCRCMSARTCVCVDEKASSWQQHAVSRVDQHPLSYWPCLFLRNVHSAAAHLVSWCRCILREKDSFDCNKSEIHGGIFS